MSQLTFAEAEYENKKRKTRRELFVERMEALIPWKGLEKQVALLCQGRSSRRPPGLSAAGDAAGALPAAVLQPE